MVSADFLKTTVKTGGDKYTNIVIVTGAYMDEPGTGFTPEPTADNPDPVEALYWHFPYVKLGRTFDEPPMYKFDIRVGAPSDTEKAPNRTKRARFLKSFNMACRKAVGPSGEIEAPHDDTYAPVVGSVFLLEEQDDPNGFGKNRKVVTRFYDPNDPSPFVPEDKATWPVGAIMLALMHQREQWKWDDERWDKAVRYTSEDIGVDLMTASDPEKAKAASEAREQAVQALLADTSVTALSGAFGGKAEAFAQAIVGMKGVTQEVALLAAKKILGQ